MEYQYDDTTSIRSRGRSIGGGTDSNGRPLVYVVPFQCLTWEVPDTLGEQFRFCRTHLGGLFGDMDDLRQSGKIADTFRKEGVLSCQCYMSEPEDWNLLKGAWEGYWGEDRPSTTIHRARFEDDRIRIEIELTFPEIEDSGKEKSTADCAKT